MLYWIDPEDGVLLDQVDDVEGAGADLIERAREHFVATGRRSVIAREVWTTDEHERTELDEADDLDGDGDPEPLDLAEQLPQDFPLRAFTGS